MHNAYNILYLKQEKMKKKMLLSITTLIFTKSPMEIYPMQLIFLQNILHTFKFFSYTIICTTYIFKFYATFFLKVFLHLRNH